VAGDRRITAIARPQVPFTHTEGAFAFLIKKNVIHGTIKNLFRLNIYPETNYSFPKQFLPNPKSSL